MSMAADQAAPSSLLLPVLVVLTAVVMTLEILQRLLLARVAAVALLGAVWGAAFPPELQVRAALGALVYHGGAELLLTRRRQLRRQRRRRLGIDHDDRDAVEEEEGDASGGKDWRFIRSLLFLVRVFVWGATLAATAAVASGRAAENNDGARIFFVRWWHAATRGLVAIVALAGYCEALEVVVLLYFADQEVPYRWRKRAPLWALSSMVGVLEASGLLSFVARRLVTRVSTLGLVGALVTGLWVSVQLPWRRVAALVETVATVLRGGKEPKTERPDVLFRSRSSDVEVLEQLGRADDWRYTDHDRERRRDA
ncbi:hypothetical protein PybrP1_009737 [[Pythium] brassicae (nom. inval.)]|nr:hypothetical protein PybrP1_009737 [[Pythium] brassicae (nom. inval.)]